MTEQSPKCTCTEEGYSPECPRVFLQGGVLLHSIDHEMRLKPRRYPEESKDQVRLDVEEKVKPRRFDRSIEDKIAELANDLSIVEEVYPLNPGAGHAVLHTIGLPNESNHGYFPVRSDTSDTIRSLPADSSGQVTGMKSNRKDLYGRGNMKDDSQMMEGTRRYLQKFEALEFNGRTITQASIGGYKVDLMKAAEKVQELAPLPESKLPIIFEDDDLNFIHHFFQGLEIMMGRETVISLASQGKYFDNERDVLLKMIKRMISTGYEKSDNELTLFTKKVLTSTFEIDQDIRAEGKHEILIVVANLWGFQYIESGMQCKDSDLRMWLSICYNHYRTVWFNAFKGAGIPEFALEGVQTRYESHQDKVEVRIREPEEEMIANSYYYDNKPRRSRKSRHQSSRTNEISSEIKGIGRGWNRMISNK